MSDFGTTVRFHRAFVDLTGSITAALMLSQLVYWTERTQNDEGWIYKKQEDWSNELGMTVKEQRTARKRLKEFDWYEESLRKANGAPTVHYRLDIAGLQEEILELSDWDKWNCPKGQMELSQRANGFGRKGQMDLAERDKTLTYTTTDTTTDNITPATQPSLMESPEPAKSVHTEVVDESKQQAPKKKASSSKSKAYVNEETGVSTNDIKDAYMEVVEAYEPGSIVDIVPTMKYAKILAEKGWRPEQVTECYIALKAEDYWRDRPVNLITVAKNIGAKVKQSGAKTAQRKTGYQAMKVYS